ncbi:hypothetical protein OIU84_026034 [Salix udensis]|uniref:Uncharacterized protein n=1 Tax=Salix udensis TaxID=889485 RepID=A0AAD6PD61_9ROSI|nr:hypothetical protein OIU84_026034 [Salix udensis]
MAQLLLCLALADAFLGLAMASEKVQTMVQSSTAPTSSHPQAPTQNLYDAQAPMIRRLGKHHHQKMVQTVVAPGLSPSMAPHQAPENVRSKTETSPLYQTRSSSEASSAEESVSIQVQATHLLPNHHHSADKSIAGGGVILGGLATTFLVAVFCYIRATGRHKAGGATS